MLSKEKKQKIADAALKSDTFKNAPTSIALLQYLLKANFEERSLKESIIDMEFFGGDPETDATNPRVRVNVYNLRKKLNQYYETEGVGNRWKMIIDKGQYSVRFEKQKAVEKAALERNKNQVIPYLLLIVAIIGSVVSNLPKKKPAIWDHFLSNKHSTYLYVGDAFGYGGLTVSGLRGWTRDFTINSLDDYYQMLEDNPELKEITSPTDYYYSTRMAENATHSLSRFFTKWNADFEIRYATRTSFSEIKEGNTIYVGRLKDQTDFVYLFNEANTFFHISTDTVEFSGHSVYNDTLFVTNSGVTETDYTVVSRIPGPDGTEQFLFFSNHDIGVMATVEYFTDKNKIDSFTKEHLKESPYFTAIFIAKGKERINLDLETILVVPF